MSWQIWVFNNEYTQYMPLPLLELQALLGQPTLFVFDCCSAGNVMPFFIPDGESADGAMSAIRHANFSTHASGRCLDEERGHVSYPSPGSPMSRQWIVLCACGPNESLPTSPDVPADLFTACLTTPIKAALMWFIQVQLSFVAPSCATTVFTVCLPFGAIVVLRLGFVACRVRWSINIFPSSFCYAHPFPQSKSFVLPVAVMSIIDALPGDVTDRRTPHGEMNWVYTTITDTIAWSVLPRAMFLRLFRQDLMVASLFRNFLLADRIMRAYSCTPMSFPAMPTTHNHPVCFITPQYCVAQSGSSMVFPCASRVLAWWLRGLSCGSHGTSQSS